MMKPRGIRLCAPAILLVGVALAASSVRLDALSSGPGTQDAATGAQTPSHTTLPATQSAAYKALEANHLDQAEAIFKAVLEKEPNDVRALAGMGTVRMQQGNFLGAISFLEEATQGNPNDKEVAGALETARFRFLMGEGQVALNDNNLTMAEKQYRAALQVRPSSAEALTALAGTLLASNQFEQAVTLYSQMLTADHDSIAAWQGLVRVQHAMGNDQAALATLEGIPPSTYATAMRDPGFEATVASIYQAEKKPDVAQALLEKLEAEQSAAGRKTPVGVEMQLAGIYVEDGNPKLALPIYQKILTDDPSRTDAWGELLFVMHSAGSDKEAGEQMQQIPAAALAQLESNANTLQTMASVYQAQGQSQQAQVLLNRVQQIYGAQHTAAPVEIEIQDAWLLYNSEDDASLYRQLMVLGGRSDLSPEQSRKVQAIWANWAVRRANQTAAAGNPKRALAILNAAARAFPDNPAALKTLADGYAHAGEPEKAVVLYKAQKMSPASVEEYEASVGAALAAGDKKMAETWLHNAMAAFPNDPHILVLQARFEQSRGKTRKANDYYRASLKAMPPEKPGAELAVELSLPEPAVASRLPSTQQAQELSNLLAP